MVEQKDRCHAATKSGSQCTRRATIFLGKDACAAIDTIKRALYEAGNIGYE